MMLYPDFYEAFACRAADCSHSCCKGWEIDVDEAALRRYAAVEGDLGQELRRNIYQDDDGAHFLLAEDERCPFLREDGLCRLIVDLGEDALCEICALHPRYGSRAARLIRRRAPLRRRPALGGISPAHGRD